MIYLRSLTAIFLTTTLSTYSMGMDTKPIPLEIQNMDLTKTETSTEWKDQLWLAAITGNLDEIQSLYKKNSDILKEKDLFGNNVFHVAASEGHLHVVKYLYEQNNSLPNEKDLCRHNALHCAARAGHLDIVIFLYEQNNSLPGEKSLAGFNALHIAALEGEIEIVKFLCEKNKDLPTEKNHQGFNALHLAAMNGNLEVVKFLIQICPELLNEKCKKGKLPFMHAQANNHIEITKYMIMERLKLTQKTIPDTKILITEAPKNIVEQQTGIHKKEPKISVTKSQKEEWFSAVSQGNLDNIKSLYKKNPNLLMTKNLSGANALHMAALKGNIEIVKFLCDENEALLTEKTTEGVNALYLAAQMGHLEVVKFLYNRDNFLTKEKTLDAAYALFIAIKMARLEVAKFLCEHSNTLLKEKASNGGNILHVAAQGGNIEIFKYLYILCESNNFLLEEKAPNGGNILHIAAQKGFLEIVKFLYERNYSLLKEKTPDGCSPLHAAARGGALEVVKFLCEQNNSALKEKTRDERNALHIAASWGHFEVTKFLIKTCPELLTEKCKNGRFPCVVPKNNKEWELNEFMISERKKLESKVKPVVNPVGKISNSNKQKNNARDQNKEIITKEDSKFYKRKDFEGVSNAKIKEMYENSLGQDELVPSNPKREQMIAHLLKKRKESPSVDKNTHNNSVIIPEKPSENISPKGEINTSNTNSSLVPDVSVDEHKKPELENTKLDQIIVNQESNSVDNPDISKKSKKTKIFRNPMKAATDYMKSKLQSKEEKEIEKRERNKVKILNNDNQSEKSHSTKSTKDTSSMSESFLCITDSQSEWEKSLVSQSEVPLDELAEQVKICYPQLYKLIKKSKAQFLSQVKVNSSLDIRVTLEWLKKYGFIDGTIKHDKIHVTKVGSKDCVFVAHTTHGAGHHAKWYHDPAVVVSFLTFIANCDPLLKDYLIFQFGVHCFSRELDKNDENCNNSAKKDLEKFGDDAREEGEG